MIVKMNYINLISFLREIKLRDTIEISCCKTNKRYLFNKLKKIKRIIGKSLWILYWIKLRIALN